MELGVHTVASPPSQRVLDRGQGRPGAPARRGGVGAERERGARALGLWPAAGTGLRDTELAKWSGEMRRGSQRRAAAGQLVAGLRDPRRPGKGRPAGAGGVARRPKPHLGHPAEGAPLPRGSGSRRPRSQSFAQVAAAAAGTPRPQPEPPPPRPRGPRVSPGGGGRPCPPPRAAAEPGGAARGRRPWRGAQDWAIAATCGTARGHGARAARAPGEEPARGRPACRGGRAGPGLRAPAAGGPWARPSRPGGPGPNAPGGRARLRLRGAQEPGARSERGPYLAPGPPPGSPAKESQTTPSRAGFPKGDGGALGTWPRSHCQSDPFGKYSPKRCD